MPCDFRYLCVDVIEHTGQVVHDTADEQLFEPRRKFLPYQIQWVLPSFQGYPPLEGGTPHIQFLPRLTEQPGEQGDEDDADEGDTAARHKLLHALGLY